MIGKTNFLLFFLACLVLSLAVTKFALASQSSYTASGFSQFCAANPTTCNKQDFTNARVGSVSCPLSNQTIQTVLVHAGSGQTVWELPDSQFTHFFLNNNNTVTVIANPGTHDISWIGVICTNPISPTPSSSPQVTPSATPPITPTPYPSSSASPTPSFSPSPSPIISPSPVVSSSPAISPTPQSSPSTQGLCFIFNQVSSNSNSGGNSVNGNTSQSTSVSSGPAISQTTVNNQACINLVYITPSLPTTSEVVKIVGNGAGSLNSIFQNFIYNLNIFQQN